MGLPVKSNNQLQIQIDRKDMGKADTLRYNIMTYVVEEQYDRAIEELRNFMGRENEYPNFLEKVDRYVGHAIDLVNAIRAKRKFPGSAYMTRAKQQELNERFREHFNELQFVLKKIEKIHVDLKLDDIRSTVWVVRAVVHSAFAILLVAFILEASRGLGFTSQVVLDDFLNDTINWIFTKLRM
jgi:hypothetical protein